MQSKLIRVSFKKILSNKNSFFFTILFFSSLIFFFLRYWKNQLTISYIDYGEGTYLYELLLFNKGLILYKDFFAPQPPIIYFIGSFILKIFSNPLVIKYFLFILFIFSNIFLFFLLNKFFINKFLSFLVILISFFFTNNIYWWPTFTGEPFLRIFIILFLFYFLPLEKIDQKKALISSFILLLIFFTKFTSIFLIFFIFLFLLIFDKKLFWTFFKYFFILSLILFGLFFIVFGKDFFYQTIIIRKILPIKNNLFSIPSTTIFLIKFLPFYFLNLLLGIYFFKKKYFSQSFLFLLSLSWLPAIIFNFFEGTYLYIFYPIESILPLGFIYYLLYFKEIKNRLGLKIFIIILLFWSILILIYQMQILDDNYFLASNIFDKKTTEKIIKIIKNETKTNELIISPPFFAFFSNRQLIKNFHDPFIFYYYLQQKGYFSFFDQTRSLLKKDKPKLLIVDWRIDGVLRLIDKNYFSYYKKIEELSFLNNESERLFIYLKK